jgi:hypothetical protein|nr:MAG TPA: hypothetical protein [Caudoviricetes sp.]
MAQWIEDPQGRPEVEKVTKELKLPVWKANHKGKFREFWNEVWDKIEDYILKLKGDTEKKSKGLNDRLVSAVGKHDGDFPIANAVVGNVYYSELTKKYYKCKVGGPAPMPNGNFIDMSILENLNKLENLIKTDSFLAHNEGWFELFGRVIYYGTVQYNGSSSYTQDFTLKSEIPNWQYANVICCLRETNQKFIDKTFSAKLSNSNKLSVRANLSNTEVVTISYLIIARV